MLRFRGPNCHLVGCMIALIQRVTEASVTVDGERIGAIGAGLLALIGVRPADDEQTAPRVLERLLAYRIFSDAEGRMNRCLTETGGGLLLVPQFTLAADTRKGNRPGFSSAAVPAEGLRLYEYFVAQARKVHAPVQTGRFATEMRVSLVNDGPVTIPLHLPPGA